MQEQYQFTYQRIADRTTLSAADATLLQQALQATESAYAPYSQFHVGTAARLADGTILTGSNQENASYPVGTCAERVLLGIAAVKHPGAKVESMAISYRSDKRKSDVPVSPCGMCRQALVEYENRVGSPIRLIFGGEAGEVLLVESALSLLPFAFGKQHLH